MTGETVKAIRISKNMTQDEFAEILKVSRSCIAAVESGHRAVSDGLRIRIRQKFGGDNEVAEAMRRFKLFDV